MTLLYPISADKNMSYQQNEELLLISVVVLHVHKLRIDELAALLPMALQELEKTQAPGFIRVDV